MPRHGKPERDRNSPTEHGENTGKKFANVPRWSVYLIRGKKRQWVGSVRAADDEAAKRAAESELETLGDHPGLISGPKPTKRAARSFPLLPP